MIWLKSASELGKLSRDWAFLCHSRWFLTYKPVISRTGWRKEGKSNNPAVTKPFLCFLGKPAMGAHQSGPKKIRHEEIQVQQNWPPMPFTGLVPAKPKGER